MTSLSLLAGKPVHYGNSNPYPADNFCQANVVRCTYSNAKQTNFIMEANTMNSDLIRLLLKFAICLQDYDIFYWPLEKRA